MARSISEHTFSVAILRKHVARTKGGSRAVADGTGISQRQVRALRDGQRKTFTDLEFAAFARFFGQHFVNDWLHEVGFGGARKLSTDCPLKVLARTNRASATLADALSDNGRVDHNEAPEVDAALAAAGIAVSFRKSVAA